MLEHKISSSIFCTFKVFDFSMYFRAILVVEARTDEEKNFINNRAKNKKNFIEKQEVDVINSHHQHALTDGWKNIMKDWSRKIKNIKIWLALHDALSQ